ncbi:MAG: zf-TFIIB domain-containing protein [Caulobacteraceae bacterium]
MKCPKDNLELTPAVRHKIPVQSCPSCHGMWFSRQEFKALEDEVFDLDEHAKGTLVFNAEPTTLKCPECGALLKRFNYRDYDLEIALCDQGHGLWLQDGDDTRVLALMKTEEKSIGRSESAESRWAATMKHLHSPSLLSKARDLFR